MTDGPTGTGTGIAQGAMKATMEEAAAADLTMIGSTAIGRAVITMLLNKIIRYLPSNSLRNLLRLHPLVTTFICQCTSHLVNLQRVEERIDQARKVQQVGSYLTERTYQT